ncbi:resolvase [Paenibacillus sp. FSL H7-0326]|uniref:recombinase family protein n=1 Tax=Paenibacillus sp. FSL H7-0326 TaxID=1921144 RepID=UPI00096E6681|nr:recombinase family protein [Paenibacillus sp. FSL H7-0326]OMC69081.1 resolvase [Paenibacillus sp. FSL H7-0326]
MSRKIGYARVSTEDQHLELQIDALRAAGVEERDIFMEKVTGAKKDRPELEKLLSYMKPGDAVIVWKLDRIGRSIKHLIELSELFKTSNIEFVSLKEKIDTSTATGRLMFNMLAALAEFEREMIIERTHAGLAAARSRGRQGGRPKKDEADIERAVKLYKSEAYSIADITEMTGVSKATLYRNVKQKEEMKA